MSYLTDYIPDRVRWAICTGLWLFLGFVLIRLMFDLQPMPASSDLREVNVRQPASRSTAAVAAAAHRTGCLCGCRAKLPVIN